MKTSAWESPAGTTAAPAAESFVLGVSNTTVGNGWHESAWFGTPNLIAHGARKGRIVPGLKTALSGSAPRLPHRTDRPRK